MRICVYGAASSHIDKVYLDRTFELGVELAKRGHSLTYGCGATGVMGAVARGVHHGNGKVLGVIPKFFKEESVEVVYFESDEIIFTDTMRERKQIMEDNADAFIIAPGGIGTYEEFFEILTSKQLCRHNKPIALFNVEGYYDEILVALNQAIKKNFIRSRCDELLFVSSDIGEILKYVETPDNRVRTIKDLK